MNLDVFLILYIFVRPVMLMEQQDSIFQWPSIMTKTSYWSEPNN